MIDFACPMAGHPDCRGYCTLTQIDGKTVIRDADCFRHPISEETDDSRP